MRKIMLLAVLFISLWCGPAFASQQVQLDDNRTLYDIVEQYNNLTRKIMGNNIDGYVEASIIASFMKTNDVMIPQTTTYQARNAAGSKYLFASVNGNGKVVGLLLVVSNTSSSNECVDAAARLLKTLDNKLTYRDIQNVCFNSFKWQKDNTIHSARNNRNYIVRGCNMKDYYRLFIMAVQ